MIAHDVGRVAVRHLPLQLAASTRSIAASTPYGGFTIDRPSTALKTRAGCLPRRRDRRRRRGGGSRCGRAGAAPRHVGVGARAGGLTQPERLTDDAGLIRNVGEARRRRRHRFGRERRHVRLRVDDAGLRIGAGAGPVRAAAGVADVERAEQAVHVADDRRVVERAAVREVAAAPLVVLHVLDRLRAHLRREVDQLVGNPQAGPAVGRRLAGNRLRRRIPSRRARRPAAPRSRRSARSARRSRGRTRRGRTAWSAARRACASGRRSSRRAGSAPTRCRDPRSDGARAGSATCAGRSSDRPPPGSRRTGCCRGACRRSSRTTAIRPADRRGPAPRRR